MAQRKASILSLAITCLLTTAAWADEPQARADAREVPTGLLGKVVRLSGPSFAASGEPLIGKVMAVDAEAITVLKNKHAAETVRVPFSSIKLLDIARPERRRSRVGEGLLIGMAIPAAALVGIAATPRRGDMSDLGLAVGVYVCAVAVPIGALTGAVIGSQFHTSPVHWERVDTRRVRVSVLPDLHGGIRGGLSVRF